jgi:hypothetical protein
MSARQLIEAIAPCPVSCSASDKGYRVNWYSATWPEGTSVVDADYHAAWARAWQTEMTGLAS